MAYVKKPRGARNFGIARCLECGNYYTRTGTRQRWCSKECQRAVKNRERHLIVKGDIARARCPVCGKVFTFDRIDTVIYCSPECEEAAIEERKRKRELAALADHLAWEMDRRRDLDLLALEIARKTPRKDLKNMSIADIAREARAAGMSYGAYCAKMGIN